MTTAEPGPPERVLGIATVPPPVSAPTWTEPANERPAHFRSERHRRPPEKRPKGGRLSRLRTGLVVLALLAAAGLGGYQLTRQRLAAQAFVDLGGVVLTAEAVPAGFAEAVVVTSVSVSEHMKVTAGQVMAVVTSATGKEETLYAPAAGTVAAVKVGVGGVARGGEPIVMLYDQARLTFQSDVDLTTLHRMRLGMTAYVEGPGLSGRITTMLDHVVPVVGSVQGADRLTVVLAPVDGDRGTVANLVPGLRFTAQVDTNTAPGGVPAVNVG